MNKKSWNETTVTEVGRVTQASCEVIQPCSLYH